MLLSSPSSAASASSSFEQFGVDGRGCFVAVGGGGAGGGRVVLCCVVLCCVERRGEGGGGEVGGDGSEWRVGLGWCGGAGRSGVRDAGFG